MTFAELPTLKFWINSLIAGLAWAYRLSTKYMQIYTEERHQLATGMLWLCLVIPTVVAIRITPFNTAPMSFLDVNSFAAKLQFAFALLLWPETLQELRRLWRHPLAKGGVLAVLISLPYWNMQVHSYFMWSRFYDYLALVFFFAAAIVWFRHFASLGLGFVYRTKALLAVVVLSLFVLIWVIDGSADIAQYLYSKPPFYGNIRRINYDLIFVIGLGCYFWSAGGKTNYLAHCLIFILFGYFTLWTGGRAQMLSTAVFFGVLILAGVRRPAFRQLAFQFLALMVGGLLVIALGEDDYFMRQTGKSLSGSLDGISSSRIQIWIEALGKTFETWGSAFFGYGPEGHLRMSFEKSFTYSFEHSHNFVVASLLEFGIIGSLIIAGLLFKLMQYCLRALKNKKESGPDQTVAVLLIGILVFALFDGVYYHATSLTMIILLAAYITRSQTETDSVEEADRPTG